MKKLLLFPMIFAAGLTYAQKDSIKAAKPFFTDFKVRQSFQTTDDQVNPALLQITLPGNGGKSWLIDAGMAANIVALSKGRFTSGVVAEYHRNTLISNLQNNFQVGGKFSYFKSKEKDSVSFFWSGNVKYVRDVVQKQHSALASVNLALYRDSGSICLGRPAYLKDYRCTYQLNPSADMQLQKLFAGNSSHSGTIFRPTLLLSGAIAINRRKIKIKLPDTTKSNSEYLSRLFGYKLVKDKDSVKIIAPTKLFEFSVDFINRWAVVNSTQNGERYTKLFRPRLNYYFVSNQKVAASLGASYNIGSDPLNGLKQQRFWLLALQLQI